MSAFYLFGLSLAPLYAALAQVESERGATSMNVYQIRDIYIRDVNRIIAGSRPPYTVHAKFSRETSEDMMRYYWAHWGRHYEEKTGNRVTYEVLARIHNGGPLGWKKPATLAYWAKVKAIMEAEGGAE